MSVFADRGTGRFGGRLGALCAAAAIAAGGLFAAAPADASAIGTGFYQNYQVNPAADVTAIVLYQTTATGGGTTNSFDAFAPSTLITDPFLKTQPITGTYFLGVSSFAGPLEAEPSSHLVLAFNTSFAASLILGGQDFEDIFAGFDESSLIGALNTLTDAGATQLAIDDASDLIFSFSDTVAGDGGLFGSTDTFSLVSFSSASSFGDGTSFVTAGGAAPEPAAWALMILGFGGAGAVLRRRRRATATA